MKIRYWVIFFLLFLSQPLFAIANDSNVVISQSRDDYEFTWKKANVQVKQYLTKSYFANFYGAKIPVREIYDDQTSIDELDFSINGDKPSSVKPRYSYFDIGDYYFSDVRVCAFELPLKAQGSFGFVSFKKTISDPRYFCRIYFSESYRVLRKEVNVKIPRWMKVELKEMNFEGYQISKSSAYDEENDADVYTYSVSNLPVIARETNSPGQSYIQPHILVLSKKADFGGNKRTYFNTLADQYAWYRHLTENISNDKAIVKAKALEITSGLNNDPDKVKAIFYWVQNNIRYIAFEQGIAGFKPDKADDVIRKKYGDCKGMANVTKELLKSLDFDARLCWIGTNDLAYDYSTPSFVVDNHMICALNFQSKMYFLDATEIYLGFNEYGERIQGRQCLVEDGDNYLLTKIPATTSSQNLDQEKRVMEISGMNFKGTAVHIWMGEEKQFILSQWNSTKKERTLELFKRYLSNGNNNYFLTDFKTSDVSNFDSVLAASYSIEHKNAVALFNKEYYIDLDFDKSFSDYIIDTSRRTFDFWFPYKMNINRETELVMPAGYHLKSVPGNLEIKNANYEFTVTYDIAAEKIVYKKLLIMKDIRLTKKMFSAWNKDIARLIASYNEQIVLTAK